MCVDGLLQNELCVCVRLPAHTSAVNLDHTLLSLLNFCRFYLIAVYWWIL